MRKIVFGLLVPLLSITILVPSSVFAATAHSWTERQPAGDTDVSWRAVASDADGSNLIVGVGGYSTGRLYTSVDGGLNWTERQPAGDTDQYWRSVASDADGSNLIAGAGGGNGRLYTSVDGGLNWTERQPAGDVGGNWVSVASDADGSNLIVANGTRLYTSVDGGLNWTERQPAGDTNIEWAVASDDDGSNLIAGNQSIGRLYTSSNGGLNWTERQPAGNSNRNWQHLASDSDGSNLIVGIQSNDGGLYTSSNGGLNWTERQPSGDVDHSWGPVASDADGSHLVAGDGGVFGEGARIYSSDDGGTTWVQEQPAGDFGLQVVASDDDGTNLIVVSNNRLYTSPDNVAPAIISFSPIDDSVEVGVDVTFNITFDEDPVAGVGNIILYKSSDNSEVETFDVSDEEVVTFDFETEGVYFSPQTALEYETEYYILIDAGAIEDETGNPFAGISDPTTWSFTAKAEAIVPDETFVTGDGFDGTVRALAVDDDGKILVGGSFQSYNGDDAYYIARLNMDGSLDDTFVTGDGFDSTVRALAIDADGKILVGGDFTTYDGDNAYYITRLNTDGSLDDTFIPEVELNGTVYALAQNSGGDIIVGGSFEGSASLLGEPTTVTIESAGGWKDVIPGEGGAYLERPPVPEGSETGGLKSNPEGHFVFGGGSCSSETAFESEKLGNTEAGCVGSEMTGKIYNLAITSWLNGSIEAGNDPNTIYERAEYLGETGIAYLIGLSATDNSVILNPILDSTVYTIAVDDDGKILVGGSFTTYDGDNAYYITRLNTDGSLDDTFVTGDGFDGTVRTLAVDDDGKILVGGSFTTYNGETAVRIARLNTDGSLDDTFVTGDGFSSTVYTLAIETDGKILVGGSFTTYDGEAAVRIARLNTDGSLDDTFATGGGFSGTVYALVLDSATTVVVGGSFSSYNGEDVGYIVRLTLPVEEDEEEPPAEEEEEEDNSSGSSRRHVLPTQPSVPANSDDAVKTILEQLVLVLQQLIQELLTQQQN